MIKHTIYFDGTEIWLKDNQLHNNNGPARIDNEGVECWLTLWLNGSVSHRTDGPAEIWPDGEEFWVNNGIDIDINNIKKYKKNIVSKHRKKVR